MKCIILLVVLAAATIAAEEKEMDVMKTKRGLSLSLGYHHGHHLPHSYVAHAPATVVHHAAPIVAAPATVVHHAPIARVATYSVAHHHAPLIAHAPTYHVAHAAPIAFSHGYHAPLHYGGYHHFK